MLLTENVQKSAIIDFWNKLKPIIPRLTELKSSGEENLVLKNSIDAASNLRAKGFDYSVKLIDSNDLHPEYILITLYSSVTSADDSNRRQYVEDAMLTTSIGKKIKFIVLVHYKDGI